MGERVRAQEGGSSIPTPRVGSRLTISWAALIDACFVAVLCAVHVFALAVLSSASPVMWWWPLLVSIPATLTLFVRRRWPLVSYSVLLAVAIGLTLLGLPLGMLNVAILVAIYSVCIRSSLLTAVLVGVIAMSYPLAELRILPLEREILNLVGSSVNLIVVIGWARAMRVGRLRSAQLQQAVSMLDQARDQLAADAAVVERARIAREFHDIVSHNLSVVALRAGVARALVDRNPEHARETLAELEKTSSSALSEMRAMLGALRGDSTPGMTSTVPFDEQDAGDRQPSPQLDRLEELVESVQNAGVTWRLERHGTVRPLGPGIEMTAYRVVQEAVTNVLKHAAPGHARVLLDYGDSSLRVEITNHDAVPDADVRTALQTPSGQASPGKTSLGQSPVGQTPQGQTAAGQTSAGQPSSGQLSLGQQPSFGAGDLAPGHGLIGLRERVAVLGGTLTAHPIATGFHLAAVLPCPDNTDAA